MRPCLDCRIPTERSRCSSCQREWDRTRRPPTAARGYGAAWQRKSKAEREANPICQYPGGCSAPSHSTDHTSGLTLCKRHHPTEANGGVARLVGRGAGQRRETDGLP